MKNITVLNIIKSTFLATCIFSFTITITSCRQPQEVVSPTEPETIISIEDTVPPTEPTNANINTTISDRKEITIYDEDTGNYVTLYEDQQEDYEKSKVINKRWQESTFPHKSYSSDPKIKKEIDEFLEQLEKEYYAEKNN